MYLFIKIRKHNCFYNENWAHARNLHVLRKKIVNQIIMEELENKPLWLILLNRHLSPAPTLVNFILLL